MRLLAGIALMAAFSACSATAMALRGGPAATADWLSAPLASFELALGENPSPVHLLRPPAAPLSRRRPPRPFSAGVVGINTPATMRRRRPGPGAFAIRGCTTGAKSWRNSASSASESHNAPMR